MTRPSLRETNFNFPGQKDLYRGKVRDVYFFDDKLVMVASDRISAFDVVLPEAIPYKGQILNQIAAEFLNSSKHIVPNWLDSTPDPNVSIGKRCEAIQVEMVVRGYLAGHAWREYRDGKRSICGVPLPEGLKENDKLPEPILTPTTKAHEGHDEDISRDEIIAQGLVAKDDYEKLEAYTRALFNFGTEVAATRGLILVDTKYEFGKHNGTIYLIDEVHTPDSSRFFYKEGYEERQQKGEGQKQLSKEFVRQWLIENGFQGKEGQKIPTMTPEVINSISDRYVELYEKVTGKNFVPSQDNDILHRVETNIKNAL
ncbi:MAG: phosphoribosylaminoimidazolesuccinocarboxamide synthase [Cyclobacteriaceae bacterium]|nr:phosphoribosylaminoimidazolesuccinocarboxamide synthase [Cyclobacteriaceae bacterium]